MVLKMVKKITNEIKQLIINLANDGLTKKKIAEKTGVSRTTVYSILGEENIDIQIEDSQDDQLGDKVTEAIVGEGWDLSERIPQLIYNLKRIAKKSQTNLLEMMEEIEDILDFYLSRSKKPVEIYDKIVDFVNFLKDKDDYELFENLEGLIEKGYYLSQVEEKIEIGENEIEMLREVNNNLKREFENLTESKNILMMKLLNKEREQKLNDTILKYQTHLEKLSQINEKLVLENTVFRETLNDLIYFFNQTPEAKPFLEQFKQQQVIENKVAEN